MKISGPRLLDLLLVGLVLAGLALAIWLGLWNRGAENQRDYALIEDGLYMGGYVDEPPPGTNAVLNLCPRMLTSARYTCGHASATARPRQV